MTKKLKKEVKNNVKFFKYLSSKFFYVLSAFVSFDTAYQATKNEGARVGTTLLEALLSITFMFGAIIPNVISGIILVIMGCFTIKQVRMDVFIEATPKFHQTSSEKWEIKFLFLLFLLKQ